ncbi:MAG: hypothetical protein SVS85_04315 [Candidatus Nanohaloarchaea archaeon]|nr:hypothetical protein [Candidatus Nanohaloarchaea archaeon]
MATTVRVSEELKGELETFKQDRDLSSYEEVIEELIQHEKERISMFGEDEELESWSEDDRAKFHED